MVFMKEKAEPAPCMVLNLGTSSVTRQGGLSRRKEDADFCGKVGGRTIILFQRCIYFVVSFATIWS